MRESLTKMTDGRIIVLDRDGVINRDSDAYIKSPDEWQALPGSLDAIEALTGAGWSVVVASNQSGLGRGLFDAEALDAINAKMIAAVEEAGGSLSGIYLCPHHPDENCECRKPKPGLLQQIETDLGLSLAGQPVVGDSMRDLEAAMAVGAQPILVRTGNGGKTEQLLDPAQQIPVLNDLADAVRHLLNTKD